MTTTTYVNLGSFAGQTFFDQLGRPLIGGWIKLYVAGTTTPKTAYTTRALDVPHPWPVPLDASGRAPVYYTAAGSYDARVEDQYGGLIGSQDNGAVTTFTVTEPDPTPANTLITTGFMAILYGTVPPNGWIISNGQTIGSATSSADTASDETEDLFIHLWTVNPDLVVSGGRGSSAATDWDAGKTIATPDWRGRGPAGRDSMGTSAAGVIPTSVIATTDKLGGILGAATVSLTADQNGSHSHTITPSISMGSAGVHTHPGSVTDVLGAHTHSVSIPSPASLVTFSAAASAVSAATSHPSTSYSTDAAGAHGHNLTISSDGAHTHTLTASATCSTSGTGAAHLNMQPSILVTWLIKL